MITLRVDDSKVVALLGDLKDRAGNTRPVMSEIGDIVISSIEKNIEVGGRYSSPDSWKGGSRKWKGLSPATIKQRTKKGHWPGKILQQTGLMAGSVSKKVGTNSVTIGTNKIYGAIQQFGGKAGRGHKVTIPGRPWIVVQDEDLTEIGHAITAYLMKGVK
ncbi:MAG: phage virion morphogenesis protein [Nitrospirae bacterium]|nr:phage virion morphogenesis protein [Nitrospirota bacterium]